MAREWMKSTGTDASTQKESGLGCRFRFRSAQWEDCVGEERSGYAFGGGGIELGKVILFLQSST